MFCKTCTRTFERDLKLLTIKDKYCYECGTCWCISGEAPDNLIKMSALSCRLYYTGITPESTLYSEGLALMDMGLQNLLDSAGTEL